MAPGEPLHTPGILAVCEKNSIIEQLDIPVEVGVQLREPMLERDQVRVENYAIREQQGVVGMYNHVSDGHFAGKKETQETGITKGDKGVQ